MTFIFSSLFTADMIGAAFDSAIERDAANGRVSALFTGALASAYGIEVPAAPVAAVKFINQILTGDKMPKVAHGPGARGAALDVVESLHALAVALYGAGKVKNLPMVASLPAWANREAIKTAAAAAAAKRAATVAAKKEPSTVTAPAATTGRRDDIASVQVIVASIVGGKLTANDIAAIESALATARAQLGKAPGAAKITAPAVTAPEPALT